MSDWSLTFSSLTVQHQLHHVKKDITCTHTSKCCRVLHRILSNLGTKSHSTYETSSSHITCVCPAFWVKLPNYYMKISCDVTISFLPCVENNIVVKRSCGIQWRIAMKNEHMFLTQLFEAFRTSSSVKISSAWWQEITVWFLRIGEINLDVRLLRVFQRSWSQSIDDRHRNCQRIATWSILMHISIIEISVINFYHITNRMINMDSTFPSWSKTSVLETHVTGFKNMHTFFVVVS